MSAAKMPVVRRFTKKEINGFIKEVIEELTEEEVKIAKAAAERNNEACRKINDRNRKKWAELEPPPTAHMPVHPGVAPLVAEAALLTLRETAREASQGAIRKNQSAIAQYDRPKKKRTHRNEVIAAMRPYRVERRTLVDFIEAAGVGSIDGLTIEPDGDKDFIVECEIVEPPTKGVAQGTLSEWWAVAGSPIPAKRS